MAEVMAQCDYTSAPATEFYQTYRHVQGGIVMKNNELNPAQVAEYKFLKSQVDRLMDDMYRKDAPPDAAQRLEYARVELRNFVSARRKEGVNI